MPRLISKDDLSRSTGESRRIISAAPNGLGRAIQGLAGSIAQAGQVIGAKVDEEAEKDKALDLTKARSFLQTGLMKARSKYTWEKDQDQDTWTQRFGDEGKQIHEQAGELIRDPYLRERFLVDAEPDVERVRLEVDDSARTIRQTRRITESDNANDVLMEAASSSDASESQQRAILADIHANIDGLVKNGVITPEMGAARRIAKTREFAQRRGLADVQADPAQALRWLRNEAASDTDGADEQIRKNEDFKPTPYPDGPPENRRWRIGYGSDTITTADGKVIDVKPGMRITREDAERDLKRRRGVTQRGIIKDIGTDQWTALSGKAKAALTDMAYNYGSLPDSVVAAARTGDTKKLADAVRARAGDKGNGIPGLNAQRRFKEAAMIEEGGDAGSARPDYYEFLSADAKLALTRAAEGAVAQQDQEVAQQARQAEADAIAAAGARKGELDLGIELGTTTRQSILNDPLLGDDDKAVLIRRWDEAEKDNTTGQQILDAIARGAPLPDNPGKGLDAILKAAGGTEALMKGDQRTNDVVKSLWDKAQAMPPAAKTVYEGMIKSNNPDVALAGLRELDQLQRNNPAAFDATFTEPVAKAVTYYQDRVGFESPASIFDGLRKASDPQTVKAREPMIAEGKKIAAEKYDSATIAAKFNQSLLSYVPLTPDTDVARGMVNTPQGRRPIMDSALMERDFTRLFAEAYADDPANAEKNAMKMLARTWGVSEVNNGIVMRFPPERYVPKLDGKWMKEAIETDLKKLGYVTKTESAIPGIPGVPGEEVRNYVIQPIPLTESDIASGQSPRYAVIVKNLETGEWDAVLDEDGAMLAYQWDAEPARKKMQGEFGTWEKKERERRAKVREFNEKRFNPSIEELM